MRSPLLGQPMKFLIKSFFGGIFLTVGSFFLLVNADFKVTENGSIIYKFYI